MKKQIFLTVLVAAAILGTIFGVRFHQLRQAQAALAARKPVPAAVTSAKALRQQWATTLGSVGSLQSYQGITVRSEIEGRIIAVPFESGTRVKAGDVLVEMDTASEAAQLRSYQATARLAELNLQRARELRQTNANTQADLDASEAASLQARANIEATQATLAKKRIVAPFTGRIGIRQVNIGQFLNKGDPLATLEAIDPIYADFALPQQDIARLAVGLPVKVTVDAFPGREFDGRIEAIDPRITDSTRNVRLRATLANKDETLRPGMFARIEVVLPGETTVMVLPATAVVYSPYGDSVYVVAQKDGTTVAEQRWVKVGPKRGDLIAILDGVKEGEEVVTIGQSKLRPGSPLKVNNQVVPSSSATPKPAES
ncbi:MAG TPA: efflux RND transporter periplasmic adaptor subunit [Lacunisphaera sp.]|nr:efflux RND transporter periplasmic adaptor subunit [Lacunisphaera sp.]